VEVASRNGADAPGRRGWSCRRSRCAGAAREAGHLINGRSIAVQSIPGNRLMVNSLTGRQIKESTLGTVPTATLAATASKLPPLKWHPVTLENGWQNY
jgi:hypothetical protein